MYAPLQAQLTHNGLTAVMPGWTIINNANLLPPLPNAAAGAMFGDTPANALRKLMQAFYDYGRLHWRWTSSSSAAAGQGGLVRGNAHNCACATFNANLKFLAETCCGIQGIQSQTLNEHFITVPGSTCIDSNWHGNVRMLTQGYQQFRCYKFSAHYWLSLNGQHYDACFNNVFVAQEQIIFTRLPIDTPFAAKYRFPTDKLRKLAKPLPNATHIIEVAVGGTGPGGWPGWELVNEAQLKKLR